jgi:hypothetical protein
MYTASSITAIALMMEAVCNSETSVYFYGIHGAISENAVIFIVVVVRT